MAEEERLIWVSLKVYHQQKSMLKIVGMGLTQLLTFKSE